MDESNGIPATMLVGPTGYGNGGMGGFGGDWSWILLLVLLCGGGWGMGGFGGGWGGFGGGFGGDNGIYPWLNNSQHISDGFRDAQISDQITSVRDGVSSLSQQICSCCGDIQNTLCSGFAGTTAAVNGAQNAIAQQLYSNEIASLNRSFAEQTANTAGFNGVQSSLCDIRYGSATNTRDIIDSQTRGTQAILDKLCALELDGYKRENDNLRQQLNMADLRTQLNMAQLAASQAAQNAFISQGFANEVDALYNRLNSCPIPATPVYGRTAIFACNQQSGCGCGCGNTGFIG